MTDSNKIKATQKLPDWEILAIFIGIIFTVPMLALLGSAIYAVLDNRPGAYTGILLTIIVMLVFWAIIWLGIVMFSGAGVKDAGKLSSDSRLEELKQENERLQKLVTELSQGKKIQNDSK